MNRYYIDVIGSSNQTKHIVEADALSWSESGLYEFSKVENISGQRKTIKVAYYPVNRSVIYKIETDINE